MDHGPFMDNLTLGMVKYLDKLPCIRTVTVLEKPHVQEAALTSWEQKNGCLLPQDIRNFYLATDGLQVKWNWKQKGETVPGGIIEIVRLNHLKSVGPKRQSVNSELPTLLDTESDSEEKYSNGQLKPRFKDKCKMFVLDNCQGSGKVCLVYPKKKESSSDSSPFPSIWYLDRAFEFHYLTTDFASYFRLSLVHLGIPQWQSVFTPIGPPSKTRQLLNMFAPERLVQKFSK